MNLKLSRNIARVGSTVEIHLNAKRNWIWTPTWVVTIEYKGKKVSIFSDMWQSGSLTRHRFLQRSAKVIKEKSQELKKLQQTSKTEVRMCTWMVVLSPGLDADLCRRKAVHIKNDKKSNRVDVLQLATKLTLFLPFQDTHLHSFSPILAIGEPFRVPDRGTGSCAASSRGIRGGFYVCRIIIE